MYICIFTGLFCTIQKYIYNFSQHVAVSIGTAQGDFELLSAILNTIPDIEYICLDVANGYSEHFVALVKKVRAAYPKHTIMVSLA